MRHDKMRYIAFLFSLFHSLLFSQDPVINFNPARYQFVTMTFEAQYAEIGLKKHVFDLELAKQHMDSCIHGPLHIILIADSRPPKWQLAYPVQKAKIVKKPLACIEIISPVVSIQGIRESNIEPVLSRLELQMKELGIYRAFHTIIKCSAHRSVSNPFVEIIVPVLEKNSPDALFYHITHNLITTAVLFYVLGAFVLVFFKPKKSHLLFALFMITIAMARWDWLLSGYKYTLYKTFPCLFYLGEPFTFLLAPSLFMAVLSITQKSFKFKPAYFLHLIPFVFVCVLLFFRFYQQPVSIKQELILSRTIFSPMEQRIGMLIVHLQMIGYFGAAFFRIRRYQKEIPHHQASIRSKQINWFYLVLSLIVIIHYSGLIKHALFHFAGVFSEVFSAASILGTLVLIVIIMYHMVRHPRFFSVVDTNLAQKIKQYSLSVRLFEAYKDQLLKYIQQNKPYLDSDITLQKLSDQVSIPPHSLSEVINRGFNQNFFEFINTYRINEAKILLAQSSPKKTVLEIVYEVGYNNKSVFNAVFKKYTRKTPTEYRLQMIE